MEELDEKAIEASERIHHPYADENGVEWTVEAWERVKHAPEFVRPGIRKLMVQRGVEARLQIHHLRLPHRNPKPSP